LGPRADGLGLARCVAVLLATVVAVDNGYIIGILFQLAEYHILQLSSVQSTSLLQERHKPRGDRIGPVRVEDIKLAVPTSLGMKSTTVCSTLYNLIAGCTPPDFGSLRSQIPLSELSMTLSDPEL